MFYVGLDIHDKRIAICVLGEIGPIARRSIRCAIRLSLAKHYATIRDAASPLKKVAPRVAFHQQILV
jgi:hypothetical protein